MHKIDRDSQTNHISSKKEEKRVKIEKKISLFYEAPTIMWHITTSAEIKQKQQMNKSTVTLGTDIFRH